MHTRRPQKNLTGRLAAALIAASTVLGSAPASAQICKKDFWQHEELRDVAVLGGSWTGGSEGRGQLPTLRFRLDGGCVEVMAPGWDWMALSPSPDVEGSYEGSVSRRDAEGLEVTDLRFRFAGGASLPYIEYETWFFSVEARRLGNDPEYRSGTLFHRN